MNSGNEGIYISGGSLNADQVAVGKGSMAIKNIYGSVQSLEDSGKQDVAKAVRDLITALEQHSDQIKDKQEIIEAIQHVAEEADKESPSKVSLKGILSGIKNVVEPITEVAQKVTALRVAIGLMLGIPGF